MPGLRSAILGWGPKVGGKDDSERLNTCKSVVPRGKHGVFVGGMTLLEIFGYPGTSSWSCCKLEEHILQFGFGSLSHFWDLEPKIFSGSKIDKFLDLFLPIHGCEPW